MFSNLNDIKIDCANDGTPQIVNLDIQQPEPASGGGGIVRTTKPLKLYPLELVNVRLEELLAEQKFFRLRAEQLPEDALNIEDKIKRERSRIINICNIAARNGNLEGLRRDHEHGYPWDVDTCEFAAENGHLACLKYAHENGCELDTRIPNIAAMNGHLPCLEYACENGYLWSKYSHHSACEAVAMSG